MNINSGNVSLNRLYLCFRMEPVTKSSRLGTVGRDKHGGRVNKRGKTRYTNEDLKFSLNNCSGNIVLEYLDKTSVPY